jgi:hypothetical protein
MRRPGKRHQIDHAFGQVAFIGTMVIVLLLGLFAIRDRENHRPEHKYSADRTDSIVSLVSRFVSAAEVNFNQRGGE